MTVRRAFVYRSETRGTGGVPPSGRSAPSVLPAVREDIRQTLRIAWIDPGVEAAAQFPVFFTAAWSAVRPNVGKTFLLLARLLRMEALTAVRAGLAAPDLRGELRASLSEEELRRCEEAAAAAHLSMAKAQIVVHALSRAAERDRIPGTGREESPIRRGVPDWQRWISLQATPDGSGALLQEAAAALGLPGPPVPLRLLGRWPAALSATWSRLGPIARGERWAAASARLRRIVLSRISSLPHPVELQWPALAARGFGEEERSRLVSVLAAHDAAMACQTLMAAYVWTAFGAPEIGTEG